MWHCCHESLKSLKGHRLTVVMTDNFIMLVSGSLAEMIMKDYTSLSFPARKVSRIGG
jgi:hypothetical protein